MYIKELRTRNKKVLITVSAAIVLVVAVVLAGCTATSPVCGTWHSGTRVSDTTITFNQDGTFTSTQGISGQFSISGNKINLNITASGTSKDETYTFDISDNNNTLIFYDESGMNERVRFYR